MTISKAQWEVVTADLERLNHALQDLRAEVDYLKYKRIPDLERRLEDGKNNHNNR